MYMLLSNDPATTSTYFPDTNIKIYSFSWYNYQVFLFFWYKISKSINFTGTNLLDHVAELSGEDVDAVVERPCHDVAVRRPLPCFYDAVLSCRPVKATFSRTFPRSFAPVVTGTASSQRTAAVPNMAPGATKLSLSVRRPLPCFRVWGFRTFGREIEREARERGQREREKDNRLHSPFALHAPIHSAIEGYVTKSLWFSHGGVHGVSLGRNSTVT